MPGTGCSLSSSPYEAVSAGIGIRRETQACMQNKIRPYYWTKFMLLFQNYQYNRLLNSQLGHIHPIVNYSSGDRPISYLNTIRALVSPPFKVLVHVFEMTHRFYARSV